MHRIVPPPPRSFSLAGLAPLLCVVAIGCADNRLQEPAPERIEAASLYLSAPGAPAAKALPAIDVDVPDLVSPRDTSPVLLEERLDAVQRRAFIGIKSADASRTSATAVQKADPMRRERTVRRGVRSAIAAETVDRALASLEGHGVEILKYYENLGLTLAKIPSGSVAALLANEWVDFLAPDDLKFTLQATRMPAGRRASSSATATSQVTPWGIEALRAPQAWAFTQGSGAKLLLIDKGHLQGHEDLPSVPTANCLGGYHSSGCSDFPPEAHGTHMLGVATARDNGLGTVGVAPGIPGTSVFVWGACYEQNVNGELQHLCDGDQVVGALNWATQNLTPNGVINMSFVFPGPGPAFATAIASAASAGIVMVAAAGNNGLQQVEYPAGYSDVIGVSGLRQDSTFATSIAPCPGSGPGSNWGPHVDFAAPWDAYSTIWDNQYAGAEQGWCGTSEAAAYVSGVVLLLRAQGGSASDIVYQMALTAKNLGSPDKLGAGLPRADLALGLKATNALASIQSGKPKLTWNVSPLATEYRIYRRVTPTLSPQWTLWAVRTSSSYTDVTTSVSSIWSNNSCFAWPSQTAVAYHVRAYNATHNVEHVYTSCPTYIANGTPPF